MARVVHIPMLISLLLICFGLTSVEAQTGNLSHEEGKSHSILLAPKI